MARMPDDRAVAYRVRAKNPNRPFRRFGRTYGGEVETVDAKDLAYEQRVILLNTDTLEVEEVVSPRKAADAPVEEPKGRRG